MLMSLILITGLLSISVFSVFGLHAAKLYKPNIYECELQYVNENTYEQFRLNEPRKLTCVYRCRDANGKFKWAEQLISNQGCTFIKTMYKTDTKK